MLVGHGDDRYQYSANIRADFSSNVVPGKIPEMLLAHLRSRMEQIGHYPEPDAASLATTLALHHSVQTSNVLVCNGSVEAFYLLAQRFRKTSSTICAPSFAEYEDACCIHQHRLTFISSEDINNSTYEAGSLLWLGNPNNPDGKITTLEKLERWLKSNPKSYLIIDEAYAELCAAFQSAIGLLSRFENLIVIRSFTKCFAIPGLRLGYLLASEKIVSELKLIKMPWSVNQLAIDAGHFILNNYQALLPDLVQLFDDSIRLQRVISVLQGFRVIPSTTNYFLLETEKRSGSELKTYLLEKHGLLVRDVSNFRFSEKNKIRIACQSEAENLLLIDALKKWNTTF